LRAWELRYFGVPLALAAFVAVRLARVRPRRRPGAASCHFGTCFAVLFFVSLGSLVDPSALAGVPAMACFPAGAVALAKVVPILLLARLARIPE